MVADAAGGCDAAGEGALGFVNAGDAGEELAKLEVAGRVLRDERPGAFARLARTQGRNTFFYLSLKGGAIF